MSEIPKTYNPEEVEDKIYKKWEESGKFNPDNLDLPKNAEAFSVAMPPPNATGILHVGHASMLAYQDLMIRYNRLKGKRTLWLPGTDHAAIATQAVVEKIIAKEGKTKYDLGREKFLSRVNEFIASSQSTIKKQVRKMGSSCDWSRERYTLDSGLSHAVKEVFVKMYDNGNGLIYRGFRVVNWCPHCESTLADDEVEYKEEKMPFYYFKYGPIIIGTARPETKFADKVIVVHPDDPRYKHLIGKTFTVPWIEGDIEAKVIADPTVDKDFGTGAMTITPAHSFEDFELAKKYGFEIVEIIDKKGNLTKITGQFAGMNANKARHAIVEKMKQKGLVDHIDENYVHNLSICYRCGTPIEPRPSLQWFIDVNKKITIRGNKYFKNKSLKEVMLKVVKSGEIKIIPERFEKIYFHWIENLRDWCISRQLWFGHRIPVWYKNKSKIKNQKSKIWNLKIYGEDIFSAIKNGTKKIETRAGKPKGSEKYWGDFKDDDIIRFSLADEKTDEVIKSVALVEKKVKKIIYFKSIDEMFKIYKSEDDYPGKSISEVKAWWKNHSVLYERILKHGIWVFELADSETEQIYAGIEPPKGEGSPRFAGGEAGWKQDSDTLDTWFSSGMWTFSTLLDKDFKKYKTFEEWMKNSSDLKRFHPTSVMETGYDIIFFWVARMILMTTYAVGQIPFEMVYLHGMVRDKEGRKMSKSLGNGIDPLEMIAKYGTDALRMSMIIGSSPGNDIKLYEEKVEGYRNFANKLWNISRFILSNIDLEEIRKIKESDFKKLASRTQAKKLTLADKWILAKLSDLVGFVTKNLENFNFSAAGEEITKFMRDDFADWYLEIAKVETKNNPENKKIKDIIFIHCLKILLKLLHPFTPFVTEEIWSKFNNSMLMTEKWPLSEVAGNWYDKKAEGDFNSIKSIITSIRNLRSENKIEPALKIKAIFVAKDKNAKDLIESQKEIIKGLARLSDFTAEAKKTKIVKAVSGIIDRVEIYLPLEGAIDITKEIKRIEKDMAENEKMIRELAGRLANKNFADKAKREIVEETRKALKASKDSLRKLNERKTLLSQ